MSGERKTNLIQSLPLHGRHLIEASAGTGKTYTLAGLYLRLVLGVGGPARMPPDILVLTFTRAATRELRDRIRARLVEAARAFRSGSSEDSNLQWLIDQFTAEQHRSCARLLDVAAGWMDEAAIHTIHAWCQTMLRQHAFDSGSLFEQEVDAPDPMLLNHALADYWRQWWYADHPYRPHLGRIAASFDAFARTVTDVRRSGADIVSAGQPVSPMSPGDYLDALRDLERGPGREVSEVLSEWPNEGESVAALLQQAKDQGHFYADSRSGIPEAKAALSRVVDQLDAWQPGQPFPVDLEYLLPVHLITVCKKNKAPDHPWLERLQQAFDEMGGYPDCSAAIWTHAVHGVNQRLAAEKQRANALDFDDLLDQLDQALDGPAGEGLRQTLLAQYPIALVDEFQDTDPVQYAIFDRVWGHCSSDDEGSGLFLIGDPKQSIYSFRGADIHAYMAARERTESRHSLGRNFRSTKGMVQAVNQLFDCGDGHPRGAFAFSEPGAERTLPFEPVDAEGRQEALFINDAEVVPMTLMFHPEGEGKGNLGVTEYRDIMAEQAAETIADLLERAAAGQAEFRHVDGQRRALRPADIAVLVRKKTQADLVLRALRRRQIAAVYLSDRNSIFDTAQARELCLVLLAIAEAGDERRLKSALATRLFGWSAFELDALNQDEQRIEEVFERFEALLGLWRRKGVLAMLHRLLEAFDVPARLLADPRQGERALTNLLHLAELLQAESQALEGEHALIQWLLDQVQLEDRGQNDAQQLRLESDAELVRVVTCHAAKGLEYPLVFAPFVCDYSVVKKDRPLAYHNGSRRVIDLDPDEAALGQATLESLQEELRLFYVTVTRARHACWLGVAPVLSGVGKGGPALAAYPFGHLLLGLAADTDSPPAMRELLGELLEQGQGKLTLVEIDGAPGLTRVGSGQSGQLGQARSYRGLPREPWWIASYSALKQVGGEQAALEPQDAAEDQALEEADAVAEAADQRILPSSPKRSLDIHGFPRGPRPGTFLHGLLEWAGRQGLAETAADPGRFLDQIERRCRLRGWNKWTGVVQQWMRDQLHQPMRLNDQQLCLADLARGHFTPELEFWFQASRVDTVALDRLVRKHSFDAAQRKALARNELNGMMRGFIDLVFEHQGRYYVLDYKSNHLGDGPEAYSDAAMSASVLDKRYDLQFAVYTLALHRLLASRLPDYDYERHVGGAVYLYLRGCGSASGGVFHYRPDRELIQSLDKLFAGEEVGHAA
ncbi:MAG: exodeoxyribonuclease V subunit beta [Wenzhouxiangella sp.]|nr:MAG: exodeoxyribonuclease V subunit beta [Wenzhouxiangella sp.]